MNKKNLIIIISILVFIMIVGGVSYSYFVYNKDVGDISLTAGEISITLSGVNGNQTFSNMIPMTDYEGMNSNSYFDFTVNGTVDTERIYYEVYILPDTENTLDTSYLKTYLTDQSNNELNGVTIFNDLYESEVENGKVLYKGIIEVNSNGTTQNETKNFRLRLWLDESYTPQTSKVFDFDVYLYAKNVDANFYIPTFRNLIEHNVSQTYIASYKDITDDPEYSTYTTQDTVGVNNNKQIVYYYTGEDAASNANVLFAGYCWQIVRTTDNGGVRLLYNGVAVNNKCETTRTATKGINAEVDGATQTMSAATLYGRSYDYDLNTGTFTIEDSTGLPTSWSTSDANSNGIEDYKELIGTYTCLSNSTTCSTLYYVGSYYNSTKAHVAKYTIGDIAHYSQMGTSVFNPNYYSPAMVGYMFNTEYDYKSGSKSGEYYTTATWNGTTYDLTVGNNGTAPDITHHYICNTTCAKVRYYYYVSGSSYHYYILLENGATIEDAIYKMTGNGTPETKAKTINANYELNTYNSAMKGYLDNWYKKNLTGYTSFLDGNTVYCNDRSIIDLGGWNPSGTSLTSSLQFKQYRENIDLNCVNETDRFAVTNVKAKLTYPIGLQTEPERNLMTANFAKTGQYWWLGSPDSFYDYSARVHRVSTVGGVNNENVVRAYGLRPVIALKPGTEISGGTGTYLDPYIVGPLVTRSE